MAQYTLQPPSPVLWFSFHHLTRLLHLALQIRNILSGTVFCEPIILKHILQPIPGWVKLQILFLGDLLLITILLFYTQKQAARALL
jgi:hypothetical protein